MFGRRFLSRGTKFSVIALLLCTLNSINPVAHGANRSTPEIKPISSIKDLPKRFKDIKFLAFQKMNLNQKMNLSSPMPISILISPNSHDCSKNAIKVIRGVEKSYQKTLLPRSLTLIFANLKQDRKWVKERTGEILEDKYRSYQGTEEINPETVNGEGDGVLWAINPCRNSGKLSSEEEVEIAHGFAHVIQTMQFTAKEENWGRWGEVPRWMLEGGATFTHNYWKNRRDYETYFQNSENLYDLSKMQKKFFFNFLKYDTKFQPLWTYTDQWENQRAYDVGAFVCEILVAYKGPESIMNLYSEYLVDRDFEAAFKRVYGITWREAHPIIADTIYRMLQWNASYFPWYNGSKI